MQHREWFRWVYCSVKVGIKVVDAVVEYLLLSGGGFIGVGR